MTTLKIATINVNGVRAAFRKGMADWVVAERPDIIALQEVRADTTDLLELFGGTEDALGHSWHVLHDAASAKGRAGVAVLSRFAPIAHRTDPTKLLRRQPARRRIQARLPGWHRHSQHLLQPGFSSA